MASTLIFTPGCIFWNSAMYLSQVPSVLRSVRFVRNVMSPLTSPEPALSPPPLAPHDTNNTAVLSTASPMITLRNAIRFSLPSPSPHTTNPPAGPTRHQHPRSAQHCKPYDYPA